jgi:ABC-type uncharacterized transport system ATPase subunit
MIMNILAPDSEHHDPRTSVNQWRVETDRLPARKSAGSTACISSITWCFSRDPRCSHATARKRALGWLERLQLGEQREKKVEELSKGQQQKIQFIGCAIHEPEIFVLDEPLAGLDPVSSRVLLDLIREFQMQGKTVMFSTHVMEQAEALR